MKQILIMLAVIAGMCTCGYAQDGFTVKGALGGTLGGKLVLMGIDVEGPQVLGQAMMVNGSFEFTGKVEKTMPAYVLTEQQQPIATLMLENMTYSIIAGESGIEVHGGGDAQKILNEFEQIEQTISREQMKMRQEAQAAYATRDQMKMQTLQQQFEKMMEELGAKQKALMDTYKNSPVTAFVIASSMEQMDYTSLKDMYEGLGDEAKQCSFGVKIARQIELLKQVEVGSVAPDFKGVTAEGETVSLYQTKGKLKLVDFWASWCGPCRAEIPNVCKVYKKYHEKGLEIIGVSLDEKKDDWEKAMKGSHMTWINISDLQGWRSPIVARYLVRGIPCTFLLDENNCIIAKNLRGKELEKKIAELLEK